MNIKNCISGQRSILPETRRIFAFGDIHGRIDDLDDLLDQVFVVMRDTPMDDQLVFLGDYVDRGHASNKVISRLLELQQSGLPAIFLKGNHEDMMCKFLDHCDTRQGINWIANGGGATIKSYGAGVPVDYYDHDQVGDYWERIVGKVPKDHNEFLQGLVTHYECGGYLFVHAGISPSRAIADQKPEDLLWIREPFLSSSEDFGAIVVHGHTGVEEPRILSNRISIDTGALGGYLTVAVLTSRTVEFMRSN